MSILSDFEDRVGRAIEGVFAGVFRSPVQPAELARAASKEMDRRKKLGVGKVYAPTLYSILLSAADAEQLGGFADTMAGELETYLMGYAHERDYELPTRPRVRFLVDEDLKLGRFMVIGELLSHEEIEAEFASEARDYPSDDLGELLAAIPEPEPVRPSAAPVAAADDDIFDPESTFAPDRDFGSRPISVPRIATVSVPGVGHDIALTGSSMVIGRLGSCDIRLEDANTSREHVRLTHDEDGWFAEDLGSTNGTLVNGRPIRRVRLTDGDVITIGVTELVFRESGS